MQKLAKNYAFIDSNNMHCALKILGWRLDYKKFRIYLTEKYGVKKAYLFLGYLPRHEQLYLALRRSGFELIFKPILEYADGTVKGNCDAELVLQAMIELPNYEKAVIVTGDGDFYCLVRYLREQNKLQTLLVPDQLKYSCLLKTCAGKQIAFMNQLQLKLKYEKDQSNEKDP